MGPRTKKRSSPHSSFRARAVTHWGRSTWDALFLLASDFPHEKDCVDDDRVPHEFVEERRRGWRKLLKALPDVLSCGICSEHFARYLERNGGKDLEKALVNRENLFAWLYRCKHEVNRRNGQGSPRLSHVRRKYIPKCRRHVHE